MKKKILGLALMAMSLVAFNGMAQNSSSADNSVKQENIKGKKADKQGRRDKAINPFEGLNLSDAQKSKLQQLDAKRQAERQQQMQARKENKQRNDSAKLADRRAAKKSYLEEVKAIIGPDQYVVFLENMYVNGGGNGHGKAFKQGKDKGKQGMAADRRSKDNRNKDGKKRPSGPMAGNRAEKSRS